MALVSYMALKEVQVPKKDVLPFCRCLKTSTVVIILHKIKPHS